MCFDAEKYHSHKFVLPGTSQAVQTHDQPGGQNRATSSWCLAAAQACQPTNDRALAHQRPDRAGWLCSEHSAACKCGCAAVLALQRFRLLWGALKRQRHQAADKLCTRFCITQLSTALPFVLLLSHRWRHCRSAGRPVKVRAGLFGGSTVRYSLSGSQAEWSLKSRELIALRPSHSVPADRSWRRAALQEQSISPSPPPPSSR
jgi:hypothetical protein